MIAPQLWRRIGLGLLIVAGCARQPAGKAVDSAKGRAADSSKTSLPSGTREGHSITISFMAAEGPDRPVGFEITGVNLSEFGGSDLEALPDDTWTRVFRVEVAGNDSGASGELPPLAGSYRLEAGRIQFRPRYPLELGLGYKVSFHPNRLALLRGSRAETTESAESASDEVIIATFKLPKPASTPTTTVTQVFPSAKLLPENQLKFYIRFSAPMSRGEAYQRVRLLDSEGRIVDLPFLELDEELWDPSFTRLTLLFDPGRIKRGLRPREEFGAVLEEGKSYTLLVDRDWPDAAGNPLREGFRKNFEVAPPDVEQPDPDDWTLELPRTGTTEPVRLLFPEPLDHAMLLRVLAVYDSDEHGVPGQITIGPEETSWIFTPDIPWRPDKYAIFVQTDLEDLAGNSIARMFDVDLLEPISRQLKAETVMVPFRVRSEE